MSFPASYYETRFTLVGAPDPLPPRFAIITAHNPMDRPWSPRMNATADQRLRRLLERKLLPHFRATGHAPDHSHAEPGWAIVTDLGTALAIARRFKQRALWWIEDNELHLIASARQRREIPGTFTERIA
ncbi:DUF3293 domain-containing protein [Haloferula sp. A504]|uniref:DUF3293 domain-containing protein n=1 Tax=Haloferula sp. A504 TaxID=3373601 RepID=UPI0031C9B273|nr:DUF3293 domain-containing protein [Verrucomicrobiaceae bacterium E54]